MKCRICALRGRGESNIQRLEMGGEDCTNAITTVAKDNFLFLEYGGKDLALASVLLGVYEYPHGFRAGGINPNVKYLGSLTQSCFEANNLLVFEYA